jgi:signal transduction histidine kinase
MEHSGGAPAAAPPVAARRGLLELAVCALEDLDRAVNGGVRGTPRRVSCRELVHASLERSRPSTGEPQIKLFWDAGPAFVEADPTAIARALDNLLDNALEHGSPPLIVTGARIAGRLRITVANRASRHATGRNGDDPRHGHGIPTVTEVARASGGRFALYRSDEGCVAALELPLAEIAAAIAA